MANPNIVNVTNILGNTATQTVSTSMATIVSNPASSGCIYKINSLSVANYASNTYNINVQLNNGGANSYIARNVTVPAGSVISIVGKRHWILSTRECFYSVIIIVCFCIPRRLQLGENQLMS